MPQHPQGHVLYRSMGRPHPVIERGEGVYLFDDQGRRYLDASGGPLVVNIGHGVAAVAQAMADQAGRVAYVHGSLFTTAALEAYSERLAARVPLPGARFYYVSSGSEAVETAIKFARQVQMARGERDRDRVIARWGSYHGATLGTLAVSGKASMRGPYATMFQEMPHVEAPYCYRCPFGATPEGCDLECARQLEAEIRHQGPERVAAFLAEPVGGATLGAILPPKGYWPLVGDICRRHGVLLIADEVLTGFGRTGTWFAVEQVGGAGEPADVLALAKGMAGGYLPMAAAAVRGDDVESIRRAFGDFNHGGTYSHHAVGAAAALATMDCLEGQGLVGRAARLGTMLGARLRAEVGELPSVGDVRGLGLLWAVEFVADRHRREPYPAAARFADRVCGRAMELGVLLYPGHGSADGVRGDHVMVAPPFVVTEEQIGEILAVLRQAIAEVAAGLE